MKTGGTGVVQPGEGSMDTSLQQLLTQADTDSTRGNNFQLQEERFGFDVWRKFFAREVVRHWNRLPRDIVDVPSLKVFKAMLDQALSI